MTPDKAPQVLVPASAEEEARLLAPWQAAYTSVIGHCPTLAGDAGGPVLVFPPGNARVHRIAIGRADIYPHPAVRAHLRALGYAWDDEQWFTTVPTPMSLRSRMRALGYDDSGFAVQYYMLVDAFLPQWTWFHGQCRGVVPVPIGTSGFYRRFSRPDGGLRWDPSDLLHQLNGVRHDMTKHALALHLVPAEQVRALSERVGEALRTWTAPYAPDPLTRFYENDLTLYCQSIWRDLPEPAGFAPTFTLPHNLHQLYAALDRRIEESHRGLLHWALSPKRDGPPFRIERLPRVYSVH